MPTLPKFYPPVLSLLAGVIGIAIVAAPPTAHADDREPDTNPFDKGSWTFQTYGGYWNELGAGDQEAGFATAGVGYYFADGLGLSLELTALGVGQPGADAVAGEAHLLLRHHLVTRENWSFFLDVGLGLFESDQAVPSGGTRFNFTTQTGLGFAVRLRPENVHLLLGGRFFHLSNARLEGDDRNPSVNAAVGYVGLLFAL
jgi:hypothetical protein